ncbi:MAG: NAD-dependent epimerase/dehydratase family protein [Candidatus Aminicenantes bacterium]|nr:NAD-dependent epimerase/dehydratase family protein [Candidatus Aminicenantes bacterium]
MQPTSTQFPSAGPILITGANGFLVSKIVSQSINSGMQVRATDRMPLSLVSGLDYFYAEILDPDSLATHLSDMAVLVHVAGLAHIFDKSKASAAPFKAVNETGTANVTRAAAKAGVKHFILISSVSVYGGSRDGGAEDSGCYPQGPYAESKYQAEQRAIEISEASGMALTILRLATLYGEGDPGNVARLMRSIDRGRFIWIGNGSNHKSLLHREDAAWASLAVMQSPAAGVNIYNVSAPPCTMREVVEGLAGALGKRIPSFGIPASLVRGISGLFLGLPITRLQTLGATAQKWLADDVYDGIKFAQAFNFQPRVNLTEGLHREVVWYRAEQAQRDKNRKF